MAGFGMIVAGALKGAGAGLVAEARAKREAAIKAIEEQNADRRINEQREFQSREAEIGRKATADENEKDRASKGEYGTTETGDSVFIQGGRAKPITGDDGKPVRLAGQKSSDKPAEVATAEWLIKQGVAGDAEDAWRLVRSARADPEKSRAAIFKEWMKVLKPEFGNVDGDKLQEEAQRRTEETLRYLDGADGSAPSASGSSAATPSPPPAPREPDKRKVGELYTAPDGRKVRWRGNGWEVVE